MPDLPAAESGRAVVEATASGRRIADVDDRDTWQCRPHAPGEIREALVGRHLTAARRQGKSTGGDHLGQGVVGAGRQADRNPVWLRFDLEVDALGPDVLHGAR
ncbi:DNA-formamidopyrimidine glycosylase family protein [Phycicoccus sp. 3266]|uniref:DNA-formamidopyrimidine glycosylase family protein n=1 Tax=Phycicoccus sp. 3266 TaxID=2817751 RepID=UPI00285A4322|nr:DNA-formamidopyrimidine glycosylase family protein [Phycicoccus sp. 3266]MDR6861862.1 hypothetical protein [Phycicoccus sp. 3266]